MTDKNTEIMRDAFRLLSAFETVPAEEDSAYWGSLTKKGQQMAEKWGNDPIAVNLVLGIIDGLQDKYKAIEKHQQMRFDVA